MAKLYASKSPDITEREIQNGERTRAIAPQGMVLLKNGGSLPFKNVKTLAAFGSGVRRTIKGGTGSGDVNTRTVVNVQQGLEDAGFVLTSNAWLDLHDKNCTDAKAAWTARIRKAFQERGMEALMEVLGHPYKDPDVPEISEEDLKEKADAALYVIARTSGEGADRHPVPGDYELTENEKQNLEALSKVYDKIAVVLNVGGVIDTKFLRACPAVDSILIMSQAGNFSGYSLADAVTGKTVPSGHLTTTWAENYTDYPNALTFSHMNGNIDDEYYHEGIYVGYRYFDTFNVAPAYPFGYGLAYTSFDVRTDEVKVEGANIIVKATVKNTGTEYAGREVVQVYYSAPNDNGPDKPYQELAGFAKTKELAPGEEQQLTICFAAKDMASYCEKHARYCMSKGIYYIRVGTHSRNTHIAAAVELPEKKIVSILQNKVQPDEEFELIHPDCAPYSYEGEEAEKAAAPVLLLDPEAIVTETIVYSGEPEEMTTDKDYVITLDDVIEGKADLKELVAQLTIEEMAELTVGTARGGTFGANSTIGAASNAVPGAAGDTTSILIESRHVPNLVLADGPAGLRLSTHFVADPEGNPIPGLAESEFDNLLNMGGPKPVRPDDAEDYYQYCTAIPIATLLAQTWDMDAVEAAGDIVGSEMEEFGAHLWLAPGMNIHRNPLCGRNFEYYSEDPLVAGCCAAADTRGVQKHPGCGTTIKHFCLNNAEDNRNFVNSHCSERAIREIFLKGFEIAVKTSQPLSLMTSYNLVNGEHAANKYDTVTSLLRDEWGFEGFVMTDWGTTGGMTIGGEQVKKYPTSDAAGCIKAGNDLTEPGNEMDVESIIRSVGAKEGDPGVRYPITKAELQLCAYRILKVAKKIVVDKRNAAK